jgi:hypothetical protein
MTPAKVSTKLHPARNKPEDAITRGEHRLINGSSGSSFSTDAHIYSRIRRRLPTGVALTCRNSSDGLEGNDPLCAAKSSSRTEGGSKVMCARLRLWTWNPSEPKRAFASSCTLLLGSKANWLVTEGILNGLAVMLVGQEAGARNSVTRIISGAVRRRRGP